MLTTDTKRRIDAARQVLVGKVPNPISQIQEITNALIYKFMDDMDEKAASMGGKRRYFTDEYAKYSWRAIMDPKIGAHERIGLYTEALSRMSKNPNLPELFRNIFRNAYLPFNDGRVLTLFLKEIDYFDYSKSQELGDAYEYLLSIMGSQGDAGQFRTPRHIIDFMVAVINPTKSDSVLDPACGTAGFLISAYKHVLAQHDGVDEEGKSITTEKPLTADEKKRLHAQYKGFDIDDSMVKMAQVNLYLHGFPDPKIMVHDTLSSQDYWQDRYDVILANPPFMSPKGGSLPHNKFGIKSTRSEVLFVDYITSHLKPHGRAAIIVPEGIIFHSGKAHKELRKNLVNDGLYAVVSLPSGVFNPYAGVKTSILLFDNSRAKETDQLLFVKINNDGYDLGATKRKIAQNDLPEAEQILNLWKQGEKSDSHLALYVPKSKIAESGDYNLSGDRYRVTTDYSNAKWPMVELGEIYEVTSSKRVFQAEWKSTGVPFYRAREIVLLAQHGYVKNELFISEKMYADYSNKYGAPNEGDLMVTGVGTLGVCYQVKSQDRFYFKDGNILWFKKSAKNVNSSFIKYLFESTYIRDQIKSFSAGGTVGTYTIVNAKKTKVVLPPLLVQDQIVAELDGYAAIIAGAKQIVTNWKPKIDIDLKWEKVKLGDICSFEYGGALPEKNRLSGSYPVIGSNGIVGSHNDFLVNGPVIVVGRKGSAGEVNWIGQDCFPIDTTYFVRILNSKELDQRYLFFALLESDLKSLKGGGAVPGLNRNDAYQKTILLPPFSIQKQIVAKIESERALVESARKLIEIYEQKTKETVAKLWRE